MQTGPTLRILFLTQTFPRYPGDTAGPFIRDLARALVRGGDRVTVLVPHAAGLAARWEDEGIEVRSFRYAPAGSEVVGYGRSLEADERLRWRAAAAAPLYLLGARRAVARELERQELDLVQAHWLVPNGLAAASVGALGAAGGPVLAVGLHGSDVFLAEKRLLGPAMRRTLRRTAMLTGCSPELVNRVRRLGFVGDRWRVIPYGVDTRLFTPQPSPATDWRRRLQIPERGLVALGVGRMATKKGFQVLVEALPEIVERLAASSSSSDLHVVLAGAGDLQKDLERRSVGLPVHFVGAVEHDALPDLYRAADLFVLPAVHDRSGNVDGLPNVILEAMATGLPVVASGISGIPLAVDTEVNGLLVAEGSAPELVRAVVRLASDENLRRRMGEEARRKAESELTWDAVAARYREAYVAALASRD